MDVSHPGDPNLVKMRLGGVVHAARMAWALGIPFDLAIITPSYVEADARDYLQALGARSVQTVGQVSGSPNVILIPAPKETGPQNYQWVIGDGTQISIDAKALRAALLTTGDDEVLVFLDDRDVEGLRLAWPGTERAVHVDSSLRPDEVAWLGPDIYITSAPSRTGSPIDPEEIAQSAIALGVRIVVVKENRGGASGWTAEKRFAAPAVLGPVRHSVGVGDAYDVALLYHLREDLPPEALLRSALFATNYASTTDPDVLRRLVSSSKVLPKDQAICSADLESAGRVAPLHTSICRRLISTGSIHA